MGADVCVPFVEAGIGCATMDYRLHPSFKWRTIRQRMQKVLFPEGLVYADEAFRTPVTCLFFRDLEAPERELQKVVARLFPV